MTTAEQQTLAGLIGATAELFSHRLSDAQLALYVAALADRELGACRAAFSRYVKTPGTKWFPKPGEILALMDGDPDDRAVQAWLVLGELIIYAGPYKSVLSEDAAWARSTAQVFGGWPESACARNDMEEPVWQAKRKEFAAAYRWHHARGEGNPPILLDGFSARDNRYAAVGGTLDRPVLRQYLVVLTKDFEMQERRVDIDLQTHRPRLTLREILALPQPQRMVMTLESRGLLSTGDEPTNGPRVEEARAQFLALLERSTPKAMP